MAIIAMGIDSSLYAKSTFVNNLDQDITIRFQGKGKWHTIKAGTSSRLNEENKDTATICSKDYTSINAQPVPSKFNYTITGQPGTDGKGTLIVTETKK